eukprot:6183542-Pleurochrysis_carterae.AAC.3
MPKPSNEGPMHAPLHDEGSYHMLGAERDLSAERTFPPMTLIGMSLRPFLFGCMRPVKEQLQL